jgi:hypothetical protein
LAEYVVQSGPLRTFDHLFDPRFEKIKAAGDYHTVVISKRPVTVRRVMAEIKRAVSKEITFVSSLFAPFAQGHRTVFGIRDITGMGKSTELLKKLQGQKALQWSHMQYSVSEDDLVLVELKNFTTDFQFLSGCVPPKEGALFFYLTSAPFDVFSIYWERAARGSLKSQEDVRLRRDFLQLSNEAKFSLFQDNEGSYTVVLHSKHVTDVDAVEKQITSAGEQAGINITFAPGLFG